MNKIIKFIMIMILSFSMTMPAFASEVNVSAWALYTVNEAVAQGFVSEALLEKGNQVITRKELAALTMSYYNTVSGSPYASTSESPFVDESSVAVVSAVELGFFSGVSETEFNPDGEVTREQMAAVMARLFTALNIPLTEDAEPFNDNNDISSWAVESALLLKGSGILNGDDGGNFNPKNSTTVEQAIIVIMNGDELQVEEVVVSGIGMSIGGGAVSLGDDMSAVVSEFGEPTAINGSIYTGERYVYADNYNGFVMIGFINSQVVEIYSNSRNMSYNKYSMTTYFDSLKSSDFSEFSSVKAVEDFEDATATLYFDISGNKRVDSVHIKYKDLPVSYSSELEDDFEEELFHIINSGRVKNGLSALTRNIYIDAVSKSHSEESRGLLRNDYNSRKGLTPFERLDAAKINYIVAAENFCAEVNGDAIEIYAWWMNNIGTRANLMAADFTDIGIGTSVHVPSSTFYTTVDLVGK